jgi:carboxymethylenebutenolidase
MTTGQTLAKGWNQFQTKGYDGIIAENMGLVGHNGDAIEAYFARPIGAGPFPGIVLVHHLPGWDEFYRETARRFAQHGYVTICPNLYARFGDGTPDDVAARARGAGGVADDSVVGDCSAAASFVRSLPYSTGKLGIIGTCSGGRHSFVVACQTKAFDAIADLWGGGVVQTELTPQRPVNPIEMTKDLNCPILGLFGNEDQNPSPEQVNQHEEELKKHGKQYEFHRYDGAGHGFFYYHRPAYRAEAATDAWEKVFAFFAKHLS